MTMATRNLTPLSIPIPPQLEEALGYGGEARFVAFYWEPAGKEFNRTWAPPSEEEIEASLERSRRLCAEMVAWLDNKSDGGA